MAKLLSPSHLGLPRIIDEQQDQRAMRQLLQMNARYHGRDKTMDRVVGGMKAVEWVGYGAGIAAGGGVLYTAAKKGGRWAVVKALAVAAAAAAAEQGAEKGLRAAGASDEAIHGARLAAAIIAFILIRRRSGIATPAMSVPTPTLANTTKGWKVGDPIYNLTAKGNQPVWSTIRRRFWKNEAFNNANKYNVENLRRMKNGLAPQRFNSETGLFESKELHHAPPQRDGGLFDFMPYWPDEHDAIDAFRNIGG
jgi:hypothetical protein